METPETLGQSLGRLRRDAALSREQLAARAGVPAFELRQLETDSCKPRLPTLERVVRALGASFGQLSILVPGWPDEGGKAVLEGFLNDLVAAGQLEAVDRPDGRHYRRPPHRN
jgi:transcriptional regulator with XRE-family HTH domain